MHLDRKIAYNIKTRSSSLVVKKRKISILTSSKRRVSSLPSARFYFNFRVYSNTEGTISKSILISDDLIYV